MAAVAADISVELPPVVQMKLVLMQGIANRLRERFGGTSFGAGSRASREIGIDEAEVSRLRMGRHERFSLERLVDLCDQIGVELTITAR